MDLLVLVSSLGAEFETRRTIIAEENHRRRFGLLLLDSIDHRLLVFANEWFPKFRRELCAWMWGGLWGYKSGVHSLPRASVQARRVQAEVLRKIHKT